MTRARLERDDFGDDLTGADVRAIFDGSDGDRTRRLYYRLEALGPVGAIAVNAFRACKTSERAKLYRGGAGFRVRNRMGAKFADASYARKDWSIGNLCATLVEHAEAAGITAWGWAHDAKTIGFEHVLYVELPTGQISFHASHRGAGPAYDKPWDPHSATREKIIAWVAALLDRKVDT